MSTFFRTTPWGCGIPPSKGDTGGCKQAADYLNQAVAGLREAGTQDHLPRGLFTRAFLYRIQNQFSQAWDDLAEAQEIAERGEMKLWLVDYYLEAARLCLEEGRTEDGERNLKEAEKLIEATGYPRRDPEILLLQAQFAFTKGNKDQAQKWLKKAKDKFDEMGIRMWDWEVRELEKQL